MTITLIPARVNSKRLPGKNVMEFCGLPLVAHSIKYAQSSDVVRQVVVSTDDPQVKDIAINLGAMVIDRPKELATDHTPTIAVLQHALEILGDEVQNIILLQPTNPLRPLKLMDEALDYFKQNDLKSLFTVSQMHRKIGQITNGAFQPLNYSIGERSQDIVPTYYENGLLYITKANLIRRGIIFDQNAHPFIVDHHYGTVDIDTQEDLDYAQFIYDKYKTHES